MALLTDTKARHIKPNDKPISHGGVTGLTLHPSSTKGRGKWVLRYVSPVTQKRRNAGLGSYPEVGIAEAAKLAQTMREQLSAGDDPLELKKAETTKIVIPTFEEAARKVHTELLPGWRNKKHARQWISTLEQHVFPAMGTVPLDAITPANVADVLRPSWMTIPETAGRVKQRIHKVMQWAWAHGFCSANPVDVVDHLLPQQVSASIRTEHQPAMPWKVIPLYIASRVYTEDRYNVTRGLLLFVILTACRSGEARAMEWCEIDFKRQIWTIPPGRMKGGVRHRVPLSTQALELLEQMRGLHETLVFPSPRKQTVLSDMVLTSFLRKTKAISDTQGRFAVAHGFRSSFRDWCSEQHYPHDLAERALAHTIRNKSEAAYHRTDLLNERRPMMQAWGDYVMSAISKT
ncbi:MULTISPECIES: phage integrase central domain-containing protein [Enterobacteriaceae]|jgi:integrase|uniref:tyrosine-type recombinase/integrase n=1 Tax=Enterobacteriaceae TaxID=543 RepID=UPI000334B42E|nr:MULTISPECIES: tyrosine-type recombinase/integrase [Enterobacteriaceae]ECF5799715.1 tyrosine-type recombinase/integrase [Salmonella enterica subsp. enterica serovar Bredeney]EHR3334897.1 tyrosine-type recombinase/integrase [Salmonella enterica subsp. enterica serovar Senftenberg]EJW3462369.1 tyrosine-type recombinase/integrase [Shigella flexneri]EST81585.1 putative integrase [Escherichia coli ECA-0157]MCP5657725.1 tyrosine-type recombinase/integrase [Klebsiella pneumoniae]HBU6575263.1 tyros